MNKAYVRLEKHQGIYKHRTTGRYLAVKKIQGKQFSESFDQMREAALWRRTFNGAVSANKGKKRRVYAERPKAVAPLIRRKATPTLLSIWEQMRKLHFPTLATTSIEAWEAQFKVLKDLHHVRMEDFVPSLIDKWLSDTKAFYLTSGSRGRYGLKKEISLLGTIFNWYRNDPELGDYRFVSPILNRHRKACQIRPAPLRDKKISPEDALKFISLMKAPYGDLALVQFLTASRIGEAAGIQISNIDLKNRELMIKDCCVWSKTKEVVGLKPLPKNNHVRYCYLTDLLHEVVERRIAMRHEGSDFLFHIDGKPLGYRWIQHAYVSAQKRSGVSQRGTHILRHGMATLARRLTRSLDATMAATGHKDIKLADHYSEIGQEVQKETTLRIESHLKGILQKSAVLGCTE